MQCACAILSSVARLALQNFCILSHKRHDIRKKKSSLKIKKLVLIFSTTRVIKSRRTRWAGQVARMEERIGLYRVLVGKPVKKRPFGRPRRRWDDNIKIDLQEVGCGIMDWIELAQDRDRWPALVNVIMNLRVP